MKIHIDTTIPYEFKNKENCYEHIVNRCLGIKKSLRFIERNKGHLCVRCPVSGDYLDIYGKDAEVTWLIDELIKNNWFRV